MNEHARRALEVETAFLAGAEANLNQAKGRRLPGSLWTWTTRSQEERVRNRLVELGRWDREALKTLPKNVTRTLTGSVPRFFFGKRKTSVGICSVLAPLEHLVSSEEPPPPVGLSALMGHVRELTLGAAVPHLVGVCSPSGFTDDAKRAAIELPKVTLVLIEPRADGGWTVLPGSPDATPADCRLFDPEATAQKIKRVREEIEARSADLVTGGLSAAGLAERLGLSVQVVAAAFEQAAKADPELRVSRRRDEVLLFRGAPAELQESETSMVNRIRQLFSREGDEARKINALSERRAQLVQRRDRVYEDLNKLEARESELLAQGRDSASPAVKRRVASQIKQLRDDMNRLHATARMLGQQVDVISTHIHNLTLIQQGQVARLPAPEEITQDAVRAEEMLEQLNAEVELADNLSMGVAGLAATDEELDILKELEGPAPAEADRSTAAPAPAAPQRAASSDRPQTTRREPEAG
ncbi:MAG: hypothetical protein HRF43_06265 [Phycisphaerae bacterium]|jgi:hypothetical protein